MWNGFPNVYEIFVKPGYCGQGLAKNMLKRALTELKCKEDLLRLFVTSGNSAENLYYKLGFSARDTFYEIFLPEEEGID